MKDGIITLYYYLSTLLRNRKIKIEINEQDVLDTLFTSKNLLLMNPVKITINGEYNMITIRVFEEVKTEIEDFLICLQ